MTAYSVPMLRVIAISLCLIVAAALFGAVGFRAAAAWRETGAAAAAAGPDARFAAIGSGLRMHYREWGPANGRPLLLAPGTMAWAETFRDIAEPLSRQGYRVIAVDLPPFGYSGRPADGDYSRKAQGQRILAFADSIGLEDFVLGVHSYGGGAALEAAFTARDRIQALVLLDVALGLGREDADGPPLRPLLEIPALRDAMMALTFTNPFMIGKGLRDFIHDDSIVTDERIEIYRRPMTLAGTTKAIGRWLFTGLYNDERQSRAADRSNYFAFDKPVLIVWGRQDTVTPLAQGEEIAGLFPQSRLEVLADVNHIPHVEKPAEVARLIGAFLEGKLALAAGRKTGSGLRGALN